MEFIFVIFVNRWYLPYMRGMLLYYCLKHHMFLIITDKVHSVYIIFLRTEFDRNHPVRIIPSLKKTAERWLSFLLRRIVYFAGLEYVYGMV